MTSLNGFIKLHRKLLTWRWYQDSVVKDVFIHLLLLASFKERPWKAIIVQEGQAIVSTQKLADDLGFSRQQVRTALKKLKSTNEITIEATNRFTVITIVKWRDYQAEFKTPANESTNSLTNNQPTENQLITNNQPHRKNVKNVKNKRMVRSERETLSPHGTFGNVLLSDSEAADLREKYPHHYQSKIDRLSLVIESKGKDYSNHYAVLLDWLMQDVGEPGKAAQDYTTNMSSYDIDELEEINTLEDWA